MARQIDYLEKLLESGWDVLFYSENETMPLHCNADQRHKCVHKWKAKFLGKEYSNDDNTEPFFFKPIECINDFIAFAERKPHTNNNVKRHEE